MKKYLNTIIICISIISLAIWVFFMTAKDDKIYVDNIYTDINVGLIDGVDVKLDMEYRYYYFKNVEDDIDGIKTEIINCINMYFYIMKCNESFDTILRGHLIGFFKSKGYDIIDIVVESSYKNSDFWVKDIKWNEDKTKFIIYFVNIDSQHKCYDCNQLNDTIHKMVKNTFDNIPYDNINKEYIISKIVDECSTLHINVINSDITINEYIVKKME